ncbi:hypothetical protein GTW37_21285, partial [Streptomyces sp. SID4931]|nr:hypothetical protein [Streptomyces sp. SID4931]
MPKPPPPREERLLWGVAEVGAEPLRGEGAAEGTDPPPTPPPPPLPPEGRELWAATPPLAGLAGR